jgi:glyoxylase-like metal-dependent hydrolase (beta-lactamase superfamily II)
LGHQSVLLNDGEKVYFFAGDTSFDEDQLKQGILAGICEAPSQAADTLARIREHCQERPTIYLPSHDPLSAQRLREQAVVQR